MPAAIAGALVTLVTAYVGAGGLFAIPFLLAGVGRVDERAAGTGWGFRALILPGTVLLWPLLVVKWVRAGRAS